MKADLKLTLSHDGDKWTVYNESLMAMGDSFESLDEELTRSIKSTGCFPIGSKIKVYMGFDGKPSEVIGSDNNRHFHRYINLDL